MSTVLAHQSIQLRVETFDGDPECLGPLVLMLHGGGQNRLAWSNTALALQRSGYTVSCDDNDAFSTAVIEFLASLE